MTDAPRPMRTRRSRPPGFRSPPTPEHTAATESVDSPHPSPVAPEQFTAAPAASDTTSGANLPDLHDARTHSVFVRAPDPLARWLELTLVALREHRPKTTRQDIICALMLKYVRPDASQTRHLIGLLDELERARARR